MDTGNIIRHRVSPCACCAIPFFSLKELGVYANDITLVNFELLLSIFTDFNMSDAMREHASTMEESIPDFAALRQRLGKSMKEENFWMIYFILLVPRLHGHDLEILSTPKV